MKVAVLVSFVWGLILLRLRRIEGCFFRRSVFLLGAISPVWLWGHGGEASTLSLEVVENRMTMEFRLSAACLATWGVVSEEAEEGTPLELDNSKQRELWDEIQIMDTGYNVLEAESASVVVGSAKRREDRMATVSAAFRFDRTPDQLTIWFPTGIDEHGGLFSSQLTVRVEEAVLLENEYIGPVFPATVSLSGDSVALRQLATGFLKVDSGEETVRLIVFAPLSLWEAQADAFRQLSDSDKAKRLSETVTFAEGEQDVEPYYRAAQLFSGVPELFLRGASPRRKGPANLALVGYEASYRLQGNNEAIALGLSDRDPALNRIFLGLFRDDVPGEGRILTVGEKWKLDPEEAR